MNDGNEWAVGRRLESAETSLAKNLVAIRVATGMTQEALSTASGISRATIAQLETGVSDPRLSTLAAIARAAGVPLALLLLGEVEVRSVIGLSSSPSDDPPPPLPIADRRQLAQWVNSGMLRDRTEAVRLASQWVAQQGRPRLAAVVAGMCAAIVPDPGLPAGARWGDLLHAEMTRFSDEPQP